MSKKIYVVGAGVGNESLLTQQAREIIENSQMVLVNKGLYHTLAHLNKNTVIVEVNDIEKIINSAKEDSICVLASGDVGFYSISKRLTRLFPQAEYINGIGSLQYFAARLGISYDELKIVSLHGRDISIIPYVSYNKRVFALTGGKSTVQSIIAKLRECGLGRVKLYIGENLSRPNEKITQGTPEELQNREFSQLSVTIIINDNCVNPFLRIRDEGFIRGKVPMTKEDIRCLSIAKLDIQPGDTVYDIGAGTGSVAVECARKAFEGTVYAIEHNPQAVELIHQNRVKHGAYNLNVIPGSAPEASEKLPMPHKVFIGGTQGNMQSIIQLLKLKNPNVKIVINAVTLETLNSALACLKDCGFETEVSCINAANSEKLGKYTMLKAQNPVYIISGETP